MDSTPLTSDNDVDPTVCEPRWESASLTDQTANITIAAGKLTVIVSAQPEISAKLAQRLARTDDQYPVLVQWEDESGHHSVHLSDIALAQVRQAVVFSGATAQLFKADCGQTLPVRVLNYHKYGQLPTRCMTPATVREPPTASTCYTRTCQPKMF